MRIEIRLALCAASVSAAALAAVHKPAPLPRPGAAAASVVASVLSPSAEPEPAEPPGAQHQGSGRPIFRIAAPQEASASPDMAAIPPPELPLLKGIIETAGGRQAVFARGAPDGEGYVVVRAGEAVGHLLITSVLTDGVLAEAPGGDPVQFSLRGDGESLE